MSGNPALTTLVPTTRQLTLAGQPVLMGKLKLRQKAALQHWLDALPEPNARVRAVLDEAGANGWPLGVDQLAVLLDADVSSRFEFLRIALGPFNPGLSPEDIDRLAGESADDDELIEILFTAWGRTRGHRPEPADPKKGGGANDAAAQS